MNGWKVRLRQGSEGPDHDPYAYEELIVESPYGKTILFHGGLSVWTQYTNGHGYKARHNWRDEIMARNYFQTIFGHDIDVFVKAYRKLQCRCRHCGCKKLIPAQGYPGETLWMCARCDAISHADFNEGAVI